MAKGKGFGLPGKGMMDQIQRLQKQMEETQAALAEEVVEGSSGGGAVKVFMTGTNECKRVEISPDVLAEGDVEMLQDLVMLAINQALGESQDLAARRLGPLTGGLGIPGLGG